MPRTRLISPVACRFLKLRGSRRVAVILLLSGMPLSWPMAALATDAPSTQKSSSPIERYADLISEAAERFDIPAPWIRSVLRAESDGDARATSPKGAMGLMQIMPETWAELRIHYGLGDDPYDPHDNIMAGAAYLRELFDRHGNPGFLAAYNAGPGRYETSRKGRALPPETRTYVDRLVPEIARGEAQPSSPTSPSTPAVETPSWAQAPLFAMQLERMSTADPVPTDHVRSTPDVRAVSAIAPHAESLFVARTGSGGAR